ncbi:pilus assembly protein TadG-related protein [Rhizobiaceae bacterium]|nr:pilus assembly protein TadG-related protein [Rhizobiaceae bacterium]
MIELATSVARDGRSFARDKSGNVLITTALFATPLILAVGVAVDTAETYRAQTNFQNALDAGALVAAKTITRGGTDKEAQAAAERIFQANLATTLPNSTGTITLDPGNGDGDCTDSGVVATGELRHRVFFDAFHRAFADDPNYAKIRGDVVVKCGSQTVEVALVMDNSGSMGNNDKMETAKTAAKNLADSVFTSMSSSLRPDAVKFALVPFSGMVNVGEDNKNASWMDTKGAAPYHNENIAWKLWSDFAQEVGSTGKYVRKDNGEALSRFTLYDELTVKWKGCVEARQHPYNTNDDAASTSKPETLFVPAFAPDEPDNWSGEREVTLGGSARNTYCLTWANYRFRSYTRIGCATWSTGETGPWNPTKRRSWENYYGNDYGGVGVWQGDEYGDATYVEGDEIEEENYYNSYLDDDHNFDASPYDHKYLESHTGTATELYTKQHARQVWPWKYFKEGTSRSAINPQKGGPNALCDLPEITPLTASQKDLRKGIDKMEPTFYTNVAQGAVWGWRVLSSKAPYSEGRSETLRDNKKVMVLMTDGSNFYREIPSRLGSTINESEGDAYGQAKNERIFEGYTDIANPAQNASTYAKAIDKHLEQTCTNAKKDGIQIYSVAFDVANGSSIKTLLETCASSVNGKQAYYDASDNAALLEAFEGIAESIAELAISQ